VLFAPGVQHCLVVDTLNEYVACVHKGIPIHSFYLTSIGKMAEMWIPYLLEEDNVFFGRTIYAICHRHPLAPEIMKHTHFAHYGEKMLFIFPDKMWSYSFPNGAGTTKISVLPYKPGPVEERYCAKVVSFWGNSIVVNTVCGTMVWKCFTVIIKEAIREYLNHFAPTGWQKTFDAMPILIPGTFVPGMNKNSGTDLILKDSPLIQTLSTYPSQYRKYVVFLGDQFVKRKTLIPNPFLSPLAWNSKLAKFKTDDGYGKDKILADIWDKNFEKDTRLDGLFAYGMGTNLPVTLVKQEDVQTKVLDVT